MYIVFCKVHKVSDALANIFHHSASGRVMSTELFGGGLNYEKRSIQPFYHA